MKTWIVQAYINLRVLVFVYIVLFPQLMKARKLLKTEILHRFGGFKNIIIIWIKLLTVQPLEPCSCKKVEVVKGKYSLLSMPSDDGAMYLLMRCYAGRRTPEAARAWDEGLSSLPCPSVTEGRGQGSCWGHHRSSAIPWVKVKRKGGEGASQLGGRAATMTATPPGGSQPLVPPHWGTPWPGLHGCAQDAHRINPLLPYAVGSTSGFLSFLLRI